MSLLLRRGGACISGVGAGGCGVGVEGGRGTGTAGVSHLVGGGGGVGGKTTTTTRRRRRKKLFLIFYRAEKDIFTPSSIHDAVLIIFLCRYTRLEKQMFI